MKALATISVFAIAAASRSAYAAPDDSAGIVFVAQPVALVAPDRVIAEWPFVPPGTAERAGDVVVGPDRAAAVWLDPLDVIRVRDRGGSGTLRFARVVGSPSARARLDEPGIVAEPGTYLVPQPPGRGDVWMIWAERATTVRVERPVARDGWLIWDATQRALLDWVDAGGALPAIPVADGSFGAALGFRAEAALGAAIEANVPSSSLRSAVRAWRKASIVAGITTIRPLIAPQMAITSLDELSGLGDDVGVPDPAVATPRPYHRVAHSLHSTVDLDGPGVLRVEARAVIPSHAAAAGLEPAAVSVVVSAAGSKFARRSLASAYAMAPSDTTPPPAFPVRQPLRSVAGDYLGDRIVVSVPLFPGRHRYEIAIDGGPIVVRATAARRRVRIAEAVRGRDDVDRWLRAAVDVLGADASDGARLVRHLIALREGTPRRIDAMSESGRVPTPVDERSENTRGGDPTGFADGAGDRAPRGIDRPTGAVPALLALAWAVAAGDDRLPGAALGALRPAGPEVWTLVLALARRLERADDVRELYQLVEGSPDASLVADLAELLPRSTALERIRNWRLAAADAAARTQPLDPAVGDAARAAWRGGEWALIQPTTGSDSDPPPARRWLVETTAVPTAPLPAWKAGDLTRLVANQPRTVVAPASTIDPHRSAVLDVYVATEAGDPGPIRVTVDGNAFYAYGLAAIERLQIAVAPGRHEVTISGPQKLRGWLSQQPVGPVGVADTARIQHYWPSSLRGQRVRYALPGGDLPVPVEIAIRTARGTEPGKPVRVTIHPDIGRPITVEVAAPKAIDTTAHVLDERTENTRGGDPTGFGGGAGGGAPRGIDGSDEAASGGEVRFVLRLAPGARSVWFDERSEDGRPGGSPARGIDERSEGIDPTEPQRVWASVSTRRERSAESPQAATSVGRDLGDLIDRVASSSRTLAADPDDARARVRRANDLLDLGEPGLAREDLGRLLRVPAARRDAALEDGLFARLDGFAEPTHIALLADNSQPIAIAPALLGLTTGAPRDDVRSAAIALRTRGPDAALRAIGSASTTDPSIAYVAARAHAARGDDRAAGLELVRIHRRTADWRANFEAVEYLGRAISDRAVPAPNGTVAIAYGVAASLRAALDHPRIRRALVVAAAQSGWDTVSATTSSAGQEHVYSTAPMLPPAPAVAIREALVSPTWPARSAHTLTPGNAAVLDFAAPSAANLRAQARCVRVRSGAQPADRPCALTARVDGGPARPFSVPIGTTAEFVFGSVPAGRHVLEVALAPSSEGDAASVRYVSDRAIAGLTAAGESGVTFPISIGRRATGFAATPTAPIAATVLGPTVVWVQVRAVVAGAPPWHRPATDPADGAGRVPPPGHRASLVEVVATPVRGDVVREVAPLASERDPDAHGDAGRDLAVSAASDAFLVLPETGTYHVTIRPDRGEIVARMAVRNERPGKIPILPDPWYVGAPEIAAPFTLPTAPAIASLVGASYDAPAIGRIGTLSIETGASQDNRPEEDLGVGGVARNSERVFGRIESAIGYRRALAPRLWWSARAMVRSRERTAPIAGGSSDLYADELPLGTTLHAAGSAFTQQFSEGRAWHVRGTVRLSRRLAWSDTVTVVPMVGVAASYLNTTPEIAADAADEVDPDVYNDYRYAHGRGAIARLAVRWMPFQDFIGELAADTTSNASFESFDNAGLSIGARALLGLPLLGETLLDVGYRPNYRFADADRAVGYLRHDVSARLERSLWTGTNARFVVVLWDDLLLDSTSRRNALGATLRFDLIRHRGLVDFRPDESPFASLIEGRAYAPMERR